MHDADLTLRTITTDSPAYPAGLNTCGAFRTAPTLTAIGHIELLGNHGITSGRSKTVALFCSKQCPGDLILKTYDLAQALREAEIPIISGFHTPIEQDCLKILLRGGQPIIHCPARSLHTIRLSPEQQQAIGENRLLLISPFGRSYPRITAKLASKRNDMIGAIADIVFIAYAAPNSKTLAFAQNLLAAGKSVVTFASSNPLLEVQGVIGLEIDAIVERCLSAQI